MKDNNVYVRKDNGRYEAFGVQFNRDYLPDGIYYVRHRPYGRSTTSVPYMADLFRIGDAKKIDIPTICGLEDVVDTIIDSQEYHNMLDECRYCIQDIVHLCVKKMYDMANGREDEK